MGQLSSSRALAFGRQGGVERGLLLISREPSSEGRQLGSFGERGSLLRSKNSPATDVEFVAHFLI